MILCYRVDMGGALESKIRGPKEARALLRRLNGSSQDILLGTFASAQTREEIFALFADLLTGREYRNMHLRLRAALAYRVSAVTNCPETSVAHQIGLSYGTYARAKRLWGGKHGGIDALLRTACSRFPELKRLESTSTSRKGAEHLVG